MTEHDPKQVQAEVCRRLIDGESLRSICGTPGMPNRATIFRWLADDPEFARGYSAAREMQMTFLLEETLDIADDGTRDKVVDDDGTERVDHDAINRSRLRVDTRKWLAAKLAPKKYGEAMLLKQADANGDPLKPPMTSVEIATRLASLLQAARQKNPEAFARLESGHVGEG